jgi:hypothetical protein
VIYVDDWQQPAQVGRLKAKWSHLMSDTSHDELHEFAQSIGLKRAWFQHKPPRRPGGLDHSHYDVTESKRQAAIAAGAKAISWRDLPDVVRAAAGRTTSKEPPEEEAT